MTSAVFEFDACQITSGARRGGATLLHIKRVPVEQIMLYGRWAKLSSCREYLRKGQVFIMRISTLAKDAKWSLVDLFAKHSLLAWRLVRQQQQQQSH